MIQRVALLRGARSPRDLRRPDALIRAGGDAS